MKKDKNIKDQGPEIGQSLFVSSDTKLNTTKTQLEKKDTRFKLGNPGKEKYYSTSEEMETSLKDYFNTCDTNKTPYTIAGLAEHLGFGSRTSLWEYENSESHKEFHSVMQWAKLKFHVQLEEILLNGKNNPAGAIFLAKNYGYVDKVEVETKGQYITQMIPVPAEDPNIKTINIDESNKEGI